MSQFDTLDAQDLWLDSSLMTRHCLGIAATGGGKSVFLNLILKQQMIRGGGVLHIDGKNSKEALKEFITLARQHNRWHDVRIINIDSFDLSNTYNPLLRGDADEVASRITMLIPEKGDPFFRSQAYQGVRAILGAVMAMNLPFSFADLITIMRSLPALKWIAQNTPKDAQDYSTFINFFNGMHDRDFRSGQMILSDKKLQHAFGDLSGKLTPYAVGEAGKVLNSYNPEVDIYNAIQENLLVYVALPMLRKAEAASAFAKFLLSDLNTAVGQIQDDPIKPFPTFLALMDEFSSYAISNMAPLFEQARSANVCLFPFIQTYSSLRDTNRGLSEDFARKVFGNTWNKIVFKLEDTESQEEMSKVAGEALITKKTESISENISFAGDDDDASLIRTSGRGRSASTSVSEEYEAIVRPEEFKNMDPNKGDAYYIGKLGVMKLKVPYTQLPNLNLPESEILDFPRFNMPTLSGLDLSHRFGTEMVPSGG